MLRAMARTLLIGTWLVGFLLARVLCNMFPEGDTIRFILLRLIDGTIFLAPAILLVGIPWCLVLGRKALAAKFTGMLFLLSVFLFAAMDYDKEIDYKIDRLVFAARKSQYERAIAQVSRKAATPVTLAIFDWSGSHGYVTELVYAPNGDYKEFFCEPSSACEQDTSFDKTYSTYMSISDGTRIYVPIRNVPKSDEFRANSNAQCKSGCFTLVKFGVLKFIDADEIAPGYFLVSSGP